MPWDGLAIIGGALWPVGEFGFGGFGERAGTAIIAAGCLVVIGALAAEFMLRPRERRRDTRRPSG